MLILATPWQVVYCLLILLFGAAASARMADHFELTRSRAILLYVWHTIWCLAYFFYSLFDTADSTLYFTNSLTYDALPKPGTQFVNWFTSWFTQYLGACYLGTFLSYNVIGTVGFLAFFASLKHATFNRGLFARRLALIIVLLPSVSFWTSAIGKDSISFMATGLSLWAAIDLNKRMKLMVFAVVVMFMVRPHIAGIMILALAMSHMFDRRKLLRVKTFFTLTLVLAASAVLVPVAADYAGVAAMDIESIIAVIELRQEYNNSATAGVDLTSMTLAGQVFTYLVRPLPYEARSISQLASSLDNLILIFLLTVGGIALLTGRKPTVRADGKFIFFFVVGSCLILAMTTANLGIAVRQKWMFMPMLVYLLLSVVGKYREAPGQSNYIVSVTQPGLSGPQS